MQTGIYCIVNKQNGKKYIGSTLSFNIRWRDHKALLNKNKHHSTYLQNSWNKYKEDNFEFRILEYVTAELLIQREQWWMDLFGSYEKEYGYNISPTAGSCLGCKRTDLTKLKLSINKLGKHNPMYGRSGINSPRFGKAHSDFTKNKIRKKLTGRHLSEETKQKISQRMKGENNPNYGKTHSDASKEKMRLNAASFWKGKKRSEQVKDKMRQSGIKYNYLIEDPNNNLIKVTNLTQFCKDHKLDAGTMHKVSLGKRKHHKGFKVLEKTKLD